MAALRNNGDSVRLEGVAVIEQNTAANGAGVYLRSYLADVGGDISIGGQAQIRNNQAAGNGGGIFCSSFSAGGGGALSLTVEEEVELASNQAASGGGIYHSGERVLALFDAHFDGNTAAAGLGIYNAGPLTFNPVEELESVVADIRDGLYLQDEDAIPMLYGKLALDSIIQLERSEYVVPNQTGTPIVVAVSTPQMSPGDAAAFRVPDSGFDGWTIRISDHGYEALLVPEQYAIRYENTLGAENPNPVSYTILTPTITLLPLADTGDYRFIGWFDAMEGGTQVTEIPLGSTGDETLYARWRSLLHTLTYYGNDGGGTPAENIPLPHPVREGEGATLSEERPTREGYVFAAWNTDPSGSGTTYQPGDTIANVTADISLYAQWEAVPPTIYLITYEPNGLSVEGLPEQQEVSEGQTVSLSTAFPTRSGYRFLNWNSQPDGSGVVYQPGQTAGPIYTNLTLYAQWQWVGYILTYHGNDAGESATQGIPAPVIVPEGQSVTLSAMNPTRGVLPSPDGTRNLPERAQTTSQEIPSQMYALTLT